MYYILPLGTRWDEEEKRMKALRHLKKEDKKRGERKDVRTIKEIVKMEKSSYLLNRPEFLGDCPGNNADSKLPILDLKYWV